MLTHEHIQIAQDFLVKAEQELGAGDIPQGFSKPWGAAAHVIMANAQLKGPIEGLAFRQPQGYGGREL